MPKAKLITKPSYLNAKFKKDIIAELEKHLLGKVEDEKIEQKCLNRLTNSIKKARNLFFERMVQHGLYDKKNDYFIGLSDIKERKQRNAGHLESLIKKRVKATDYSSFQESSPFFNNATKFPTKQCGAPKERTTNSGFCYYTYESDSVALNNQLRWTFGGSDDFSCVAGKIYQHLAKYKDFCGLYCVWSGNKSLHIHTEWNLKHLSPSRFNGNKNPTANEVRDEMLRDGLQHYWDIVGNEIKAIIKQETGDSVEFDEALRQPEQYRRLSWALRYFKDGSKYFPKNSLIPQIELWSCAKAKKSGKENDYLHKAHVFFDKLTDKNFASQKAILNLPPFQKQYEQEFIEYVKDVILGYVGGAYPEPVTVKQNKNSDIEIKFRNGSNDKKPSSIMKGNFKSIKINGSKCKLKKSSYTLPFTANELWLKFKGVYAEQLFYKAQIPPIVKRPFREIISNASYTGQNVRNAMEALLPVIFTMPDYKRVAMLTPEGAGKTTSLLKGIHKIAADPYDIVAVASPSYDQAEAHCNAFNQLAKNNPLKAFEGVILPSFSWAYENICITKKYSAASYKDYGYNSLLQAVYDSDDDAVKQLETWKKNFWNGIEKSNKTPVFFTVHNVIHLWHRGMGTRLWLAKNFKKEFANIGKNKKWKENLKLQNFSHVIYDELKRDDLRSLHTKDEVDFYIKVQSEQKKGISWHQAFKNIKRTVRSDMTFDEILNISEANYQKKNLVIAKSAEEQIGVNNTSRSPYIGAQQTYVKEKPWWKLPNEVITSDSETDEENPRQPKTYNLIILTTERSLFEILHAINVKAAKSGNKAPFSLFDLESILPLNPAEATTELFLEDMISSAQIKKFAASFFQSHPGSHWQLITNKCPNMPDTVTHAKAKGNNSLQNFNIASTYMFPPPSQYFKLLADDVYFGLKHGVKMAYLDEFNQSVGRNLGFRYSGNKSEIYMGKRFATDFLYFLSKHSRYKIDRTNVV